MRLKKRRVFLKKRRARIAKWNALAALGGIGLIAFLSFVAFRGGRADDPQAIPLTGQETVQAAPTTTAPTALVGTEVESVTLAATGIDMTPLLIGGLSMVLLGIAMKLSAGRRRSVTATTHRGERRWRRSFGAVFGAALLICGRSSTG